MNSPLTRKLIRLFIAVLLLFSLVVGVVFTQLGMRSFRRAYEVRLLERATAIAQALDLLAAQDTGSDRRMGMGGRMGEHRTALRFIDDIAQSDVWLLDEQARSIEVGHGKRTVSYAELNDDAKKIVQEVFQGKESLSRSFSSLLGDASITAAVPVHNAKGQVTAALLLHERLAVGDSFLWDAGKAFAAALGIAVVLISGLGVLFARRFLQPLVRIGETTRTLTKGDYSARTHLTQNDEIGELANDLDELAVRLEESRKRDRSADAARRDFSAKLSHELRTPVTVLRSSLEALKDGMIHDPNEVHSYHETLYAESVQLERLIGELLDLTTLQNPHFPLESAEVDLAAVVSDAVRSQRHAAAEKSLNVQIVGADALPWIGDYSRLRQMFVILIHNTVKFSFPGSTVRIVLASKDEAPVVHIHNFGPPIPKESLNRIFEEFHQTDGTREGFGLGLAIAKEIAQRHGATISATSSAEEGTTFSLHFKK